MGVGAARADVAISWTAEGGRRGTRDFAAHVMARMPYLRKKVNCESRHRLASFGCTATAGFMTISEEKPPKTPSLAHCTRAHVPALGQWMPKWIRQLSKRKWLELQTSETPLNHLHLR